MNELNTVTISLEDYEKMRDQIEELKESKALVVYRSGFNDGYIEVNYESYKDEKLLLDGIKATLECNYRGEINRLKEQSVNNYRIFGFKKRRK